MTVNPLLPESIPLFPLSGVAVFPELPLPLHIFEPRYRALLKDALEGDRVIGIVQIRPGTEGSKEPVFDIGCAGRVEGVSPLPDGRSNILLRGIARFRIEGEEAPQEGRLYRRARVTSIPEKILDEDAVTESLARVLHEIGQIDEGMALLARSDGQPKALVVNLLSQLLPLDDLERQSLVEASTIEERARRLAEFLEFARLARKAPAQDTGVRH